VSDRPGGSRTVTEATKNDEQKKKKRQNFLFPFLLTGVTVAMQRDYGSHVRTTPPTQTPPLTRYAHELACRRLRRPSPLAAAAAAAATAAASLRLQR